MDFVRKFRNKYNNVTVVVLDRDRYLDIFNKYELGSFQDDPPICDSYCTVYNPSSVRLFDEFVGGSGYGSRDFIRLVVRGTGRDRLRDFLNDDYMRVDYGFCSVVADLSLCDDDLIDCWSVLAASF